MSKIFYELAFAFGALAGLSMGIFLKTGQSNSVLGTLSFLIDSVKYAFKEPDDFFSNPINLFSVFSFMLSAVDFVFVVFCGWVGLISALFGYAGMLILVLTNQTVIGVVLLALGGVLALFGPDQDSHSWLY